MHPHLLAAVGVTVATAAFVACGESFSNGTGPGGGGAAQTGGGGTGATGTAGGHGGAGPGGGGSGGKTTADWCPSPATLVGDNQCELAAEQAWPEFPVIDETFVYWSNASSIGRVRKDGTGLAEELSDDGVSNECLVIDGARLWWLDEGSSGDPTTYPPTVWTIETNGAGPDHFPITTVGPRMLAVDATHLYWTSWDEEALTGSISRMSRDDASEELLFPLTVEPAGIAISDTDLFWLDQLGVHRMPLATLGAATLWSELSGSSVSGDAVLLLSDAHLYWNEREGIARAPLAPGGDGTFLLFTGFDDTTGLFLLGGFAYFADNTDPGGTVGRVDPLAGGVPTPLASDLHAPRGVAVDAESVYFTTSPEPPGEDNVGTVMKARLPKP